MLARSMAQTISIIGAGRVGRALGQRLRGRGWRIGAVVTRFPATARAAVRAIGGGTAFSRITGEVFAADLILLGTPDDVLPTVARALARVGGSKCKGKVILHTSATLDRTVLAPLARLGAATGSLHPMQAFGGKVIPKLSGVVFAIEGDRKARSDGAISRAIPGRNYGDDRDSQQADLSCSGRTCRGQRVCPNRSGRSDADANRLYAAECHENAFTFNPPNTR